MIVTLNNVTFYNVAHFNLNECELTIVFNEEHGYSSIEELDEIFNEVGIPIGNYHFNHTDCYGNNSSYGTDVLCVIPFNLRGNIRIWCRE